MRTHFKLSIAIAATALSLLVASVAMASRSSNGTSSDAAIRAAEAWAFPKPHSPDPSAPKQAPAPKPNQPMHVPGSTRSYTLAELNTDFNAPDWFPQDHLPPPRIVLHGRKPVIACAACHLANGSGAPASASLAGLPKAYIVAQLAAFRAGQRDNDVMPREARGLDAADIEQAATYFSSLKIPHVTQVIETATVPRTHWHAYALVPNQNGAREPLGERIVEGPVSVKLYALGDGRSGFIAWVPPGSIARGARIAANGMGAAQACESCHGTKLQGVGDIPYLAGRSPTYIARELILFREGKRSDPAAAPMRAEASALTVSEMIDVAAYAASRKP
ncbi:MAG: c-type cytochrome [Rhodanobacteraceae bacterium]